MNQKEIIKNLLELENCELIMDVQKITVRTPEYDFTVKNNDFNVMSEDRIDLTIPLKELKQINAYSKGDYFKRDEVNIRFGERFNLEFKTNEIAEKIETERLEATNVQ